MVNISLAHDVDNVNRTQDVHISEDVTFNSMLLKKETLQGLKESGFCYPSPIQLLGTPLGKCGFDLLLEAKSGTGKTAVFTIIALEKLDVQKGLQTIILTPTREIASQICDVIKQIGVGYNGLNVEVVIGGLSVEEDMKKFNKKVHILVASPGRLKHLMQMKVIDISAVRLLIIDEADKLMEKSFIGDINYIFKELPPQKQVIMSSATYSEESKKIINEYMKNFQHICPDSSCILKGVIQKVTMIASNSNIVRQTQYRFKELLKILSKKQFKQCLIFCNYQVRVMELQRMLAKEQWPVEALYSKQEQSDRLDALRTLQQYKCRVLISTDLAARGIDASNVDLVINFEPPYEWQTYLHRIGRAGRFGSYGVAITILSVGKEVARFRNVLKGMKNSIAMQDLWTGEIFELDSEDKTQSSKAKLPNTVSKETPKNDGVFDLWNALTSGKVQNTKTVKRDIESFDTLLDSYDNSKTEHVLSFSDLVKSFDSIQDENQDTNIYPTLKVESLPIDQLLSVISSETIDQLEISNGIPEENSFVSNTNENENRIIIANENLEEISFISNICREESKLESNNNVKLSIPKIDTLIVSHHSRNQDDDNDAMVKLGLPSCFVSKKDVDRKLNLKHKGRNLNTSNKMHQASAFLRNKDYIPKGYQSTTSVLSEVTLSLLSEDEEESLSYIKQGFVKISRIGKSKHKNKTKQENEYSVWYSQLKSHIKSIEMALYINEISNL